MALAMALAMALVKKRFEANKMDLENRLEGLQAQSNLMWENIIWYMANTKGYEPKVVIYGIKQICKISDEIYKIYKMKAVYDV